MVDAFTHAPLDDAPGFTRAHARHLVLVLGLRGLGFGLQPGLARVHDRHLVMVKGSRV